eukprot:355040-Chlamydomonas_euryale.AAC.1
MGCQGLHIGRRRWAVKACAWGGGDRLERRMGRRGGAAIAQGAAEMGWNGAWGGGAGLRSCMGRRGEAVTAHVATGRRCDGKMAGAGNMAAVTCRLSSVWALTARPDGPPTDLPHTQPFPAR